MTEHLLIRQDIRDLRSFITYMEISYPCPTTKPNFFRSFSFAAYLLFDLRLEMPI